MADAEFYGGFAEAGMEPIKEPEPPKISADAAGTEAFKSLPFGSTFIDPNGVKRQKPYEVKDAPTYRSVPDGAPWIGVGDPEKKVRTKPTFEGVDFGAQTLIDMAGGNTRQIEAVLKGHYGPDVVKQEPLTGEFYVEKEGKFYKPGKGSVIHRGTARTLAEAAPVAAATVGEMAGAAAGLPAGGVGAIPGAMIGGGLGLASGEMFNQMIMSLAGYGPSWQETAEKAGEAALWGAIGVPVGRTIARGLAETPNLKQNAINLAKEATTPLGKALAYFTGADKEGLKNAIALRKQDVLVPPSKWMFEAPKINRNVEVFDPGFRIRKGGINVLEDSARAYYNREAAELLRSLGIEVPKTPLTDASQPVSVKPFGEHMLAKAHADLEAADKTYAEALARRLQTLRANAPRGAIDPEVAAAEQKALLGAAEQARKAAQAVIDTGFATINGDVENALKVAEANGNPGDLVRLVAQKIEALRESVRQRANRMYSAADIAAGGVGPDVTMLRAEADEFLASLPEDFKANYPQVISKIATMEKDITFGQLHNLRTMLWQEIDYADLTAGVREGSLKKFINEINKVLFDKEAPPELQEAAQLLKQADTFYGDNIKQFRSQTMRWTIKQLEAGVPADPETLARRFFREGQTEEILKLKGAAGPVLWNAVQAADTRLMLNNARTVIQGEVDGMNFAKQVEDRIKSGIIDVAYDPATAGKLREQAQRILLKHGKLAMEARPGDTVTTLMKRAADLTEEAERMAKADPIGALNKEMKAAEADARQLKAQALRDTRKSWGQLNFLNSPSVGAIDAAERILESPDKALAVIARFGANSPEAVMLRKLYIGKMFQRSFGQVKGLAGEFSKEMPPELQQALFPGVSLDKAKTLANNMEFLLTGTQYDSGTSIAVGSAIQNPITRINIPIVSPVLKFTGLDPAARFALGKWYALNTWATNHVPIMEMMLRGLESGKPELRQASRAVFLKSFDEWMKAGAGGLSADIMYQLQQPDMEPQAPPARRQSWREIEKQRYGR